MSKLFRWVGALVFLLSLLSFAYVYVVRLGVPAPDNGYSARDAVFNVTLFTIFALHHSIMARTGAKAWITRLTPPALERSIYVWIASLLFLAVCWLWRPLPGVIWQMRRSRARPLRRPSVRRRPHHRRRSHRRRLGAGGCEAAGSLPTPIEFTARGPFAIVRHPIYLAWVLMVFATPVMTTSRLVFAVISTVYLAAAIPFEEASLVEALRREVPRLPAADAVAADSLRLVRFDDRSTGFYVGSTTFYDRGVRVRGWFPREGQ